LEEGLEIRESSSDRYIVKPEEFKVGELEPEQKKDFNKLIKQYEEIFAEEIHQLGRTNIIRHGIEIEENVKPIRQQYYRTNLANQKYIEEEIQRLLKDGIIKKSYSPWTSPVVLVKKKDGKLRFCVDYRKLNNVTKKDAHPIPQIDDMLGTLGEAQWFTTLDLASGYWQVEMEPKDQQKIAFVSKQGIYEFTIMPFGLTNAPATFQRLMNTVLNGMINNGVMVYLDDIIIYSKTFEEHLEKLEEVFRRIKVAGLKIKPSKCEFLETEFTFLGHVVGKDGIKPDPKKIEKVKDFPRPTTVTKIRSFLGLASYYRKFIKNFAQIARPMNQLIKKNEPFIWTEKQEEAFKILKQALITAPILRHPDFNRTFYLMTDGSAKGFGAVLAQIDDEGKEYVVSYASQSIGGPKKNYNPTELELNAAVWAIEKFHYYLGYKHFVLLTDHIAMQYLKKNNIKETKSRIAKWIVKVLPFDFEIRYRPGKINTNADTLSRL
jgi:hypothetical protein